MALDKKTERSSEKNKGGRPKKVLDLAAIRKLAMIQCTHSEIASVLGVSLPTLTAFPGFLDIYKIGQENGRKSLRRVQFASALKGNTGMLVWLGKQYLGQKDRIETDLNARFDVNDPGREKLSDERIEQLIAAGEMVAKIASESETVQ